MIELVPTGSSTGGCDLVVIGGGAAGLTAARFAARLGVSVLLAAERVGGDCTWTGCIPSKALIRAARLAYDTRRGHAIGIGDGAPAIDFAKVMAEVHAVIERIYSYESPEVLATRGIEVVIGSVRFIDGETVDIGGRRVIGRHFVLCTGAAPHIPAISGLDSVPHLTYETMFSLGDLPSSLVVVGAGATGVETAQAFARLGSRVTLVEQRHSVLPEADPQASSLIQARLIAEGVDVRLGTSIVEVAANDHKLRVLTSGGPVDTAELLVATGRTPRIAGLDLERAGIDVQDGAVKVDRHLRTTNPDVYSAGDVTGAVQFSHYASLQGFVAARNALLPGAQEGVRASVPWAVFTDPEVAQVGLTESEARRRFPEIEVHHLPLERVDRAETEGTTVGFLKLVAQTHGKLVGATAVSRAAGETVNELSLAIDHGLTMLDLISTIHVYPTFSFAVQQLASEVSLEAAVSDARGPVARTFPSPGVNS